MSGDDGEVDPPVPIPNTAVKHFYAENSPMGKDRALPGIISNTIYKNGGLAQLGEHLPYKQRVGGSSPSASTIFYEIAGLAQLVEQLICNQ